MKIVVGVRELDQGKRSVEWLRDLRFKDPHLDLVNVISTVGVGELGWASAWPVSGDAISQFVTMQEESAREMVDQTRNAALRAGFEARTHVCTGFPANELLSYVDQQGADLLVLGSSGKGLFARAMLGSVARKAVVSSRTSVLICRKEPHPGRPLTAVFATDHSAYANRCSELLTRLHPKGIGRLVVTTVYPEQLVKSVSVVVEHFKADVGGWVAEELKRCNDRLIEKLKPLECAVSARVETGAVNDAISRVVEEEGADLLIVGAQGHGFLERLMIGSVSLHQAIGSPASVLLLRVPS